MAIKFEYSTEHNKLSIDGKLTIHHANELLAQLKGKKRTALNLSGIAEIDGAGLQLLLVSIRDAQMHIVSCSDAVTNVLQLAGLISLLEAA